MPRLTRTVSTESGGNVDQSRQTPDPHQTPAPSPRQAAGALTILGVVCG
jgi:hypothetical protein